MRRAASNLWLAASALLLISLSACVASIPTRAVPTETANIHEFSLPRPRAEVFDAALRVAQSMNLNVAVLEKDSGLIRFDIAALSPAQLDQYCHYPYVRVSDGKPFDTWTNWNQRSISAGRGAVTGALSMTLIFSEQTEGTAANLRASWTGGNLSENVQCKSKDVLEHQFQRELSNDLGVEADN